MPLLHRPHRRSQGFRWQQPIPPGRPSIPRNRGTGSQPAGKYDGHKKARACVEMLHGKSYHKKEGLGPARGVRLPRTALPVLDLGTQVPDQVLNALVHNRLPRVRRSRHATLPRRSLDGTVVLKGTNLALDSHIRSLCLPVCLCYVELKLGASNHARPTPQNMVKPKICKAGVRLNAKRPNDNRVDAAESDTASHAPVESSCSSWR
jgi:hypothetical protein